MKKPLANHIGRAAASLLALLALACNSPVFGTDLLPMQVGSYRVAPMYYWSPSGIAVSGTRAYVTAGDYDSAGPTGEWVDALQILDITSPRSPTLLGSLKVRMAGSVTVRGNYAYVMASSDGLVVIDVTNPTAPRRIGSLPTRQAQGMCLVGNYAYVADSGAGLVVIDVSNPTSLRRVGGLGVPGEATGVSVSGNYAYLSDRFSDAFFSPLNGSWKSLDEGNTGVFTIDPQLVIYVPVGAFSISQSLAQASEIGGGYFSGISLVELRGPVDPPGTFTGYPAGPITGWYGSAAGSLQLDFNYTPVPEPSLFGVIVGLGVQGFAMGRRKARLELTERRRVSTR